MRTILAFLDKRYLLCVGIVGSILIGLWTLARFFTQPSIYDLIYQQVIARIAVEGGGLNATVGATHYILKIFLVYIPFEWLHLDPRFSLILMTLLINVVSFILIALAVRSILQQLGVFNARGFVVAMLWFAAMAGSIFWIEFANSRNLEVAAGLWLIAIGLRFVYQPKWNSAIILFLISTLAFFMDPMQLYMTAVPFVLYVLLVSFYRKEVRYAYKRALLLVAVLMGGYILSLLVLGLIQVCTGLAVLDSQSPAAGVMGVFGQLHAALTGLQQSNVRLIGGYVEDGGRVKQLYMLGLIGVTGILWLYSALRKRLKAEVVIYSIVFVLCIEGIYFLSGQSLNGDTSRYLIMLAPVIALVIATLPAGRTKLLLYGGFMVGVVWSMVWVCVSLVRAEPFTQDVQLAVASQYVESVHAKHGPVRFYGSMDMALTTTYYYRGTPIIPLACDNRVLTKVKLSYGKNSMNTRAAGGERAAIILDNNGTVTNYPQTCTEADIIRQLGSVKSTSQLEDGRRVLFFGEIAF